MPRVVWSLIAFLMLCALVDENAGENGSVTVILQWMEMASMIALRNVGHVLACLRLVVRD